MRASRLRQDRSILDSVTDRVRQLQRQLGPVDNTRVNDYLASLRDVERRIQKAEEQSATEVPDVDRPAGVPDGCEPHVKLLYDLQLETILGITTPWHVERVDPKPEDKRVDLWLAHEPMRCPCPECGDLLPGFDHAEAQTWRHLDTCQFQTHLHAEIPRVQCPTHGVKQVRVSWPAAPSNVDLLPTRQLSRI